MSRRTSEVSSCRRLSVPELMRRHSSLRASLAGESILSGASTDRRLSTSALEREFPNLRSTPRPSTCHSIMEDEPQSLSQAELEQLLENCTKLTRDNQLTEGRLWGLKLPQQMPAVAKQSSEQMSFNFQKVSFGLEAAVQIYSKRVDSMHNAALDTKLRLTHQHKKQEATQSAAGDVGMTTTRRRGRRASDFSGSSTLATNPETILSKGDAEDAAPLDPLFHKTSALFDTGAFKGLPTLNLGIRQGGRYLLDTKEVPGKTIHRGYDLPPDHKINLELFGIKFEPLREMKQLSQSSLKVYAMLKRPEMGNQSVRELIQRGLNAVSLQPQQRYSTANGLIPVEPEALADDGVDNAVEDGPVNDACAVQDDGFGDFNHNEIDIENTDNLVEEFDALPPPEHNGSADEPKICPEMDQNDGTATKAFSFNQNARSEADIADAVTEVDVFDEETINWLLNPNQDTVERKNRAWTGASHWKYPRASVKPAADEELSRRTKRRETKAAVNYDQLTGVDLSKFKKPDKESTITMLVKDEESTQLPTDHRFSASFLLELPLMPSKRPDEWLTIRTSQSKDVADMRDVIWSDDDVGSAHFGFDDGNMDSNDQIEPNAFGLIEEPPQIEEDRFDVSMVLKRVNMAQIKVTMWSRIEELSRRDETLREIPLEAHLRHVAQETGVSVGVCFACILHLAIEHDFRLFNTATGEARITLNRQAL